MGVLASTINIIVLDNPMTFHFSQFLDSALGQIVGCVLAFTVILLVRDKSRDRTGRVLLNQFVSAAVSAMTTNVARRKENHLPALYQQLFLLMNKFPGDLPKFRLALRLLSRTSACVMRRSRLTRIYRRFTENAPHSNHANLPVAMINVVGTLASCWKNWKSTRKSYASGKRHRR
ncbi:FUSC family protein [Escherichia coli]